VKAMRVSNLDAYKIEATYVFLPKNFSFRLKHFVVDKIQIRVTWSHALALDCIRDILCIQFVQKTRGVDVCILPSKDATSGSSRKHTTNDGCCSFLSIGITFFFDSHP
jgi:hypothetical protein